VIIHNILTLKQKQDEKDFESNGPAGLGDDGVCGYYCIHEC
jgi:hypothetical protein